MTDPREALEIFARLSAHFPALGGDDAAAVVRVKDWTDTIEQTPPDTAHRACFELTHGFDGIAPRLMDWHETCRRVATNKILEQRPALPSGERYVSKERFEKLMADARAAIGPDKRTRRKSREKPVPEKVTG